MKFKCPYCSEICSNYIACKNCAVNLKNFINFNKLKTPYCDEITAPFVYESTIREAILQFKFGGWLDFAASFAFFMKECDFQKPDLVICVPQYKNKKKFKIMKTLVLAFARTAKLKHSFNAVTKLKPTKLQHECTLTERKMNLNNAFVANNYKIGSKSVLICDDIVTSGVTVNELAKCLKQAGAKRVSGIAVAISKIILKHEIAQLIEK